MIVLAAAEIRSGTTTTAVRTAHIDLLASHSTIGCISKRSRHGISRCASTVAHGLLHGHLLSTISAIAHPIAHPIAPHPISSHAVISGIASISSHISGLKSISTGCIPKGILRLPHLSGPALFHSARRRGWPARSLISHGLGRSLSIGHGLSVRAGIVSWLLLLLLLLLLHVWIWIWICWRCSRSSLSLLARG